MNEISDIDSEKDEHGQLTSEFLDDIFKYVVVGDPGDGQNLDNTLPTPQLSDELKIFLVEAYFDEQKLDKDTDYYEYCGTDENNPFQAQCIINMDDNKLAQTEGYNLGKDRSSLDTSIALIFGNKTTIGQVRVSFFPLFPLLLCSILLGAFSLFPLKMM